MELKVNMLALKNPGLGLGFFEIAKGIATLATVGITAYSTVATLDIAKDQAEASQKLAEQKAALEADLIATQKRIFEIQADGMEERNEIDLQVAQAQAEALERQIKRADELEQMQLELSKLDIATDYELALIKLQGVKDIAENKTNESIENASNSSSSISEKIEIISTVKIVLGISAAAILGYLLYKGK